MRKSTDVTLNRIESQSFPAADFLDQTGSTSITIRAVGSISLEAPQLTINGRVVRPVENAI